MNDPKTDPMNENELVYTRHGDRLTAVEAAADPGTLKQTLGSIAGAVELLLTQGKESTRRAYASDYRAFAAWYAQASGISQMSTSGVKEVSALLQGGVSHAHEAVVRWLAAMEADGLSSATINRRLSAIRSAAQMARLLRFVDWDLNVQGVRSVSYKDTSGPGMDAVKALMKAAKDSPRDYALIRVMFDLGLRRQEISGLRVQDLVFSSDGTTLERLRVFQKGMRGGDQAIVTLSAVTAEAIMRWVEARAQYAPPHGNGPLFVTTGNNSKGCGLSGQDIYRTVKSLAKEAGLDPKTVRPHGIRHTAISEVAEISGGDVRSVKAFARHSNVNTSMKYIDRIRDHQGEATNALSARIQED